VTLASPEARAYLERLRDLLPAREADRVVAEVEAMILDRVESEGPDVQTALAERRALAHLGTPEALADTLGEAPLAVGSSARRSFARWWCVLAASHLLLSIALTLAGSDRAAVAGWIGPLPTSPWWETITAAAGMLVLDAGLLFAIFTLTGAWGRHGAIGAPGRAQVWTRGQAVRTLLLVGLIFVVAHPLRDEIFAVRRGATSTPFLSGEVLALLPWLDVVLGLIALRCLLVLLGGAERPLTQVVDFAAGLGGVVLLVLGATRSEVVHLPHDVLGPETASVLNLVFSRGLLVLLFAAALILLVSVVRRGWRLKQALGV
jgi:hypothetical protein